jgi:hypothetical protein
MEMKMRSSQPFQKPKHAGHASMMMQKNMGSTENVMDASSGKPDVPAWLATEEERRIQFCSQTE